MASTERSIVPMILGIIGGVIGLPSAFCSGMCAVGIESMSGGTTESAHAAGDVFLGMGVIGAIGGLICGLLARRKPVLAGIGMIVFAVLAGIPMAIGNFLTLIPLITFLVGGAIAIANKNKPAPGATT